jgi:hypothetical protein
VPHPNVAPFATLEPALSEVEGVEILILYHAHQTSFQLQENSQHTQTHQMFFRSEIERIFGLQLRSAT